MSRIHLSDDRLIISLSTIERLACLRGDLSIARKSIVGVSVEDAPFRSLRGIRAPGFGLPRRVAIGRWRHRHGTDLVIIRHGDRALTLDLADGEPFTRIVVGTPDPDSLRDALAPIDGATSDEATS